MSKPLLIVTGIPPPGTTLTPDLIDKMENTICLNEPPDYYPWVAQAKDKTAFIDHFIGDLKKKRVVLEGGGTIPDRREPDLSVPQNYFDESGKVRDMAMRPVGRPGA